MPTINKKFLLKVVLFVLVFTGLLFGAHALQAQRIPEALLRQSELAETNGKTDSAIRYLRHYLEFEPEDVQALLKLTELLRTRSTGSRTQTELIFLYDRILRLEPDRHDVRREALAHCLKVARYSDAVTHGEELVKVAPEDGSLWQQLGSAYAGLNRLDQARQAYDRAIITSPQEMLAYQRLAQLLWRNMSQPDEAMNVLNRMVQGMPQEPQAYLVRAKFSSFLADEASRGGRPANREAALADVHRVLELDPENAEASILLTELLQKNRDVVMAHAILRDIASLYPRDLRIIRSLAWVELVRGNAAAAIAVLEEGLQHSPNGFDLLVPLADLLVQQGDTTRSEEILKRLVARRAPRLQVDYLKARIAMRQGKWPEAVQLLEGLREQTLKLPGLMAQVNLLLASCFENTADAASQEKALLRVISSNPGNVPAHVGLADLFVNQRRFDEALREYETAARLPFASGAVFSQLLELTARRLKLQNGSPDDWRRLEQGAAAAAPKFGPVSSEPIILRSRILLASGKAAEAVKLLRDEASRRPGDTRLWGVLAATAADAYGTAAGLAIIDEAQAAAGDGPEIRLARAALYAGEPGQVRPIDPLGDHIETWANADQLRLLYGLVEVFDQMGDRKTVVHTLRRIAARRPADLDLWLRLHERAIEAGEEAIAAEARAGVARIEGEGSPSVLLCDAARDPGMVEKLLAAFGPSPNRADACLAIADLKEKAGNPAEALGLTERAFVLEPTNYRTARAWIAVLARCGKEAEAQKVISDLNADPRWAGGPFRRVIAGVLPRIPAAASEKLLKACEPMVAGEPGGLGWLAHCYSIIGKSDVVESTLTAATQSPAATSDDWLRLALHFHESKRLDESRKVLAAARGKVPPPAFFSAAAVFREVTGESGIVMDDMNALDRRNLVQARLSLKLSRSERTGATKVLEEYLESENLPPVDASWARRNLAMLYAINGSAGDRSRAMALLREAADGGAGADDLRATASVLSTLARYLSGDERKTVLASATEFLQAAHKVSKSPRDLYNLSQLHRLSGNRVASRECLNALLKSDPNNVYYLTRALEELTEQKDFAAARAFADRLRALYPGEFRAIAAVARFECRAGQPDRAVALAEGYASAADVGAGDYLARSMRVAELLDELARYPEARNTAAGSRMIHGAVERYEALVPSRPEAIVAICGTLGFAGELDKAFEKIESLGRHLPVMVRAQAGLAALRSGGASDRQFDTVRAWLNEALDAEPQSVAARMALAEFLALRQDYTKASEMYEKLIEADPRNVVALNNLAWILAADPATAQRSIDLIEKATRETGLTGELLDTRARARITIKQFKQADQDLNEALIQGSTALRWFHKAVLHLSQSPAQMDMAVEAFREARRLGIDSRLIHPADLPAYRQLDDRSTSPTTGE
jgi:tetratricopeptide (TPR) repeat protein